jgi:hypothetical protein
MDLGRGDPISLGVENDDLITVVTLAVKYQFVSVMAMRAGCHPGFVESRLNDGQLKVTVISIPARYPFAGSPRAMFQHKPMRLVHGVVDQQDHNDGTQNDPPIRNLNAS